MRLLWIDDEPSVPESSRLSLNKHGIHLSVALDAPTGLAMAIGEPPDTIILDLRLGKSWGLDVLRDLRSAGVAAPVMVLTAFAESDSAFQAGRLGVVAFHSKPLVGQQLVHAICDAVAQAPARVDHPVNARAWIESMISLPGGCDEENAVRRCARALTEPALGFCEFLALSRCFHVIQRRHEVLHPYVWRTQCRDLASIAGLGWDDMDDRLRGAEAVVANAGDRWPALRAGDVAKALGTDERTLWRVLQRPLGLSFRALVRTVVMRRAIGDLAHSDEHVRQIAFRLGYEHHTSFDRDFRRFLHCNPREFRSCLNQACSGSA